MTALSRVGRFQEGKKPTSTMEEESEAGEAKEPGVGRWATLVVQQRDGYTRGYQPEPESELGISTVAPAFLI